MNNKNNARIRSAHVTPSQNTRTYLPEVTALIALWNQLYGDIMYRIAVPQETDRLYQLICDRIQENGMKIVQNTIRRISCSSYLTGKRSNPPASLGWILQQPNFSKVLTGYYNDFKSASWTKENSLNANVISNSSVPAPGNRSNQKSNQHPPSDIPTPDSLAPQAEGFPNDFSYGNTLYPLDRDADLDHWLIDQIVHRRLHNLPPAPADTTDWEAYMSG